MSDTDAREIDAKIESLGDWRGELLGRLRRLIKQAGPDVTEELKWRKVSNPSGVPVWSSAGMICTGEIYKDKVKLTFAQGASLPNPSQLFNSSMTGGTRRAIDFQQGGKVDESALKELFRAAIAFNKSKKGK